MKKFVLLSLLAICTQGFSQNNAPVAVDDTILTYNSELTGYFNVSDNDYDPDGNGFSIDTIFPPQHGSIVWIIPGLYTTIEYQADTLYSGLDQIKYIICDNGSPSLCDTGTVWITNKQVSYYDNIDINNISAGVNSDGALFQSKDTFALFNAPKGDSTSSIFGGGVWIGGRNATDSNKIYLAGETYPSTGRDFQFGPIMDSSYRFDAEEKWWRTWKVTRQEIAFHKWNWWRNNYVIPEAILNWPAHGDVSKGMATDLAPFEDRNNNGTYEPLQGDLPVIKGNQSLYFIFNDDRIHTSSGANSLKIEVHGMAYGFDCVESGALFNTLFIDYKIINRSQNIYDDTFIGFFIDMDIGGYDDDYIACDVNRSSFYTYNGDDFDESLGSSVGYFSSLPAQSCTFLKGPLQDADGIDNAFGVALDESINGFGYEDGIADNERRGMDRFMNNSRLGSNCCIDPQTGEDYYNYMTGHWRNGAHLTRGGTGLSGADTCKFIFPKDSDPYNFGTWGVTPDSVYSWSEESENNVSGDRRGIGSTGPFTFGPGDVQEITMAFVFADSDTGNQYSSVALMQQYIDDVREMFLADSTPCGLGAFSSIDDKMLNQVQHNLSIYPNPTASLLHIKGVELASTHYEIYDVYGKLIVRKPLNQSVIDVSNLTTGLYFILIDNQTKRFVKK